MMCLHLCLLLLGTLLSLQACALSGGTRIVDTGYARYRGNFTAPFSLAFLGVPFAAPPLGSLRFRAPQPLNITELRDERDSGKITDASSYPNFCVQGSRGGGDAGGAGTEDCLKVNVYTPVNATLTSRLPVLFYVHGGSYNHGNPRNLPFEHWINHFPNVIIVSTYYRLDSFGFLAHPSFSNSTLDSSSKPADLNVGFLDQVAALQWVHDNIAAFGGDPSRITINGQSAGGSSIELHMVGNVASKKRRLFSAAILQSVYRTTLPTPRQVQPMFDFFAEQAGCGGLGTPDETLGCLREASIGVISRAQDATENSFTGASYNQFTPVLDGNIFTDYPSSLFIKGDFAKVPIMVGSTSNETVVSGSNITAALHRSFPQLTSGDLAEFETVYNISQFSSEQEQVLTATGEVSVRCGREILAGAASANDIKTFVYRYNQAIPSSPGVVGHAAENYMMFLGTTTGVNGSTVFVPLTAVETAFSHELIAYWLSFVRSGDPNTFRLPQSPLWSAYTLPTQDIFSTKANLGRRIVLQQDPKNTTTTSGSFIEVEPQDELLRCAFAASKIARTQD